MAGDGQQSLSSLVQYLPAIYQQNPFIGQFLLAFEKILLGRDDDVPFPQVGGTFPGQGLEELIAGIAEYFQPSDQRAEFLPWLAGWVALSLRADLDARKQSEFIKNVVQLYRWRGTRDNLIKLLEIFTGRLSTITEDTDQSHLFHVVIYLWDLVRGKGPDEVQRQIEIAHALIELEKPAHTFYTLEPVLPTLRIGSRELHTEYNTIVGDNTILGTAEWEPAQ
jgi:phage tail-like protein